MPLQIRELNLKGSFTPLTDASYRIILTGTEMLADGSAENGIFYDKQMEIFIYRDETYLRWDFFCNESEDWDEYLSYYDSERDISYGTMLYNFISTIDYPVYPLGEILVDHQINYGDKSIMPRREITTGFTLNFTKA